MRGPAVVEAVVVIGAAETVYRRAGHGRPVLLLTDDPNLFGSLSAGFRVIQPLHVPARPDDRSAAWLRGLIEGLGLDRPTVLAAPAWLDWLHEMARSEPERLGRVVPAEGAGSPEALLGDQQH